MPRTPEEDGATKGNSLEDRLKNLESKLNQADNTIREPDPDENEANNPHRKAGIAQAFRLSSEFIAGVVVGGGIGYLIDSYFETSPWGLIIFLLLGFAAAVLNVLRAAGMVSESEMRLKPAHDMQKSQDNSSDSD